VDVGDLGVLAANYGMTADAVWAQGDFNLDGLVDAGDLGILAAHYGEGVIMAVSQVPLEGIAESFSIERGNDTVEPVSSSVCGDTGLTLITGMLFASLFCWGVNDNK
jgi:hypothetical protein